MPEPALLERDRPTLGPRYVEVTHNVWSGQHPASVHDNLQHLVDDCTRIAGEPPHAVKVQEGLRYERTIPGYERIAHDEGHRELSNCILFVRKAGVTVHRDFELGGDEPWIVVRYGTRKEPRLYPGATISLDAGGPRIDTVVVHRVPARGHNDEAWAEEHHGLVAYADRRANRHPNRALSLGGDWNGRGNDPRPLSVPALAREIDADVRLRGIDGFLTRGFTGRVHQLSGKYGSDGHQPVLFIGHPTAA